MEDSDFGVWVLRRRVSMGLSRKDVSEKVGISSEYLRLIENSQRSVSKPIQYALKTLLGEEERLADLIYRNLPQKDESFRAVAEILAAEIVKAGYRKFVG